MWGAKPTESNATVTNNAAAYCNLAVSYVQTGNPDAALKAYAQCTNLDPHNADTWNQIGVVYMAQGNYTEALDAFDHAIHQQFQPMVLGAVPVLPLAARQFRHHYRQGIISRCNK